jgi:hypothetical protein
MMTKRSKQVFEFGVAPGVKVPAEFPRLIDTYDFHAQYRRPAFSAVGERLKDADGNLLWDMTRFA